MGAAVSGNSDTAGHIKPGTAPVLLSGETPDMRGGETGASEMIAYEIYTPQPGPEAYSIRVRVLDYPWAGEVFDQTLDADDALQCVALAANFVFVLSHPPQRDA